MNKKSFLSIITPTLNSVQYLRCTIESVVHLDFNSFEHIIIDGGSTDGTLELLSDYDNLIIMSEPDKGMYDAINKGLRSSSGEVVGILNSDDFYAPNIFPNIMQVFMNHPETSAVMGGVKIYKSKTGNRLELVKEVNPIDPEDLLAKLATEPVFFHERAQTHKSQDCLLIQSHPVKE